MLAEIKRPKRSRLRLEDLIWTRSQNTHFRDILTVLFTVILPTITKSRHQPRCPPDEWIQRKQYVYTTEFYSAVKKSETMLFAGKTDQVKIIIFNKTARFRKKIFHAFSHLQILYFILKHKTLYANIYFPLRKFSHVYNVP